MEQYSYYLDITFLETESAEDFYNETSNLIEWLSEYYDDAKIDLPNFFKRDFKRNTLIKETLEEIEFWETNELPVIELDSNFTIKLYTETFAIFLSEIAENYGIEEIDLQELISGEDKEMEIPFDDDEYTISNEEFYEDNSFNDLNEY